MNIEKMLLDENKIRNEQIMVGEKLIRAFGVNRAMREVNPRYVRYVLYADRRLSLESLIGYNREMYRVSQITIGRTRKKRNTKKIGIDLKMAMG